MILTLPYLWELISVSLFYRIVSLSQKICFSPPRLFFFSLLPIRAVKTRVLATQCIRAGLKMIQLYSLLGSVIWPWVGFHCRVYGASKSFIHCLDACLRPFNDLFNKQTSGISEFTSNPFGVLIYMLSSSSP